MRSQMSKCHDDFGIHKTSLHIQYLEGQHSNKKIILCLGQNSFIFIRDLYNEMYSSVVSMSKVAKIILSWN